jgi:PAS domain-containing protein
MDSKHLGRNDSRLDMALDIAGVGPCRSLDERSETPFNPHHAMVCATILDKIRHGICYFGQDQRLLWSNRHYAEIYGLAADAILPGMTLREVAVLRYQANTCPKMTNTLNEYLTWCGWVNHGIEERVWTAELRDGRTIRIFHQPMPDGGWIAIHEDVSDPMRMELEFGQAYSSLTEASGSPGTWGAPAAEQPQTVFG